MCNDGRGNRKTFFILIIFIFHSGACISLFICTIYNSSILTEINILNMETRVQTITAVSLLASYLLNSKESCPLTFIQYDPLVLKHTTSTELKLPLNINQRAYIFLKIQ